VSDAEKGALTEISNAQGNLAARIE
jgi:hypothetical protein